MTAPKLTKAWLLAAEKQLAPFDGQQLAVGTGVYINGTPQRLVIAVGDVLELVRAALKDGGK